MSTLLLEIVMGLLVSIRFCVRVPCFKQEFEVYHHIHPHIITNMLVTAQEPPCNLIKKRKNLFIIKIRGLRGTSQSGVLIGFFEFLSRVDSGVLATRIPRLFDYQSCDDP